VSVLLKFFYTQKPPVTANVASELGVLYSYEMLALGFPLSVAGIYVADYLKISSSFAAQWALFVLVGYVQWFILVPLLITWIKNGISVFRHRHDRVQD
jgi:hypothetical protein